MFKILYRSFKFLIWRGTPDGPVIPKPGLHVTSSFNFCNKCGFCRIGIFWKGWPAEVAVKLTNKSLCQTILARNRSNELSIVHFSDHTSRIGPKQSRMASATYSFAAPSLKYGAKFQSPNHQDLSHKGASQDRYHLAQTIANIYPTLSQDSILPEVK